MSRAWQGGEADRWRWPKRAAVAAIAYSSWRTVTRPRPLTRLLTTALPGELWRKVRGPSWADYLAWLDEMNTARLAEMAVLWGPEDEYRAAAEQFTATLTPPWERNR